MHDHDPRADNLLIRLFAYAERERRTPLENYCTEALAWCLKAAPNFRKAFLSLAGLREVRRYVGDFEILTQQGSRSISGHEASVSRGVFDLVIRPVERSPWILLIESKIWGDFRKDQLPKYRDCFQRSARSAALKSKVFIVTLAASAQKPPGSDAHIQWSKVQSCLFEAGGGCQPKRGAPYISNPESFVCLQFSEFLKEKGMAPMKIKTNSKQIASYAEGMRFRENLHRLLNGLREQDQLLEVLRYRRGKKLRRIDRAPSEYATASCQETRSTGRNQPGP
jgi:hypothetical protein